MTSRSMGVSYKNYFYKDDFELDMKKGRVKKLRLELEEVLKISKRASLKIVFLPLAVWT